MPRPGPRPYECVRRAWHSDHHQPMRGSLIQKIFKVVNEVHSPATQRNKEWQEKLPCVVLKAEEIMYSKANSEAEYMDLKTLWDRANDAIDTIIRRDKATESGDLLKPCIEAALNLGCIPRRTSRSQRHSNQVCYLRSNMRENRAAPVEIPENNENHVGSSMQWFPPPTSWPCNQQSYASQFTSLYPASMMPSAMNAHLPEVVYITSDASCDIKDSPPCWNHHVPFLMKNTMFLSQDKNLPLALESRTWPNLGTVYPLHYHDNQPKTGSYVSLQQPQEPQKKLTTSAMPCCPPIGKVNHISSTNNVDCDNRISNFKELPGHQSSPCDLSLCLGLPSVPSLIVENAWIPGIEDVASTSSCKGSKSCDLSSSREQEMGSGSSLSSPKDRCFDLFPKENIDEPLESCSSKWSSEGEGTSLVEASDKKSKVPTVVPSNDDSHWK